MEEILDKQTSKTGNTTRRGNAGIVAMNFLFTRWYFAFMRSLGVEKTPLGAFLRGNYERGINVSSMRIGSIASP